VTVVPCFRADRALAVDAPADFNAWLARLETAAGVAIPGFDAMIEALRRRHEAFHAVGCRLSDHGIEVPYAEAFTAAEVREAFDQARRGRTPSGPAVRAYRSAVLLELARMDAEADWTQQFHFGALRNVNRRAMRELGPDTGYDAIGDFELAWPLARFLDRLESEGRLARTILYVMNGRDNDVAVTVGGCFQDGRIPGKIQLGSAWWFNDQKDGIERQLDALSTMGLLSRFVGMLTDSRSFLSYPRHEYFRRVLCNLLGRDVENGELPDDLALLGGVVQDICYRNAAAYFGIQGA
jgi:glucuronate isomerase